MQFFTIIYLNSLAKKNTLKTPVLVNKTQEKETTRTILKQPYLKITIFLWNNSEEEKSVDH